MSFVTAFCVGAYLICAAIVTVWSVVGGNWLVVCWAFSGAVWCVNVALREMAEC